MKIRVLLGFLVAAVVGAGGGLSLGPMAEGLAAKDVQPAAQPSVSNHLTVRSVEGKVLALREDGRWRRVVEGESLTRPTGFRTEGPESRVVVQMRGLQILAGHDAYLLVSAPGPAVTLQLDHGLVLVKRSGRPIHTHVPAAELDVAGVAYGVLVRDGVTTTAVLDAEIEIAHAGQKPVTFARGREIAIVGGKVIPSVLEPRLTVETESITRRGRRHTLTARTSPGAVVWSRDGDALRPVSLSASGTFTVEVGGAQPAAGELIAFDAAGRRAEIDAPSQTIEEVLAAMSGTEPVEPPAAEAEAEAEEEPAPLPTADPATIRTLSGTGDAPEPKRKVRRAEPARERAPKPAIPAAKGLVDLPDDPPPAVIPASAQPPDTSDRARGGTPPAPVKVELGGNLGGPQRPTDADKKELAPDATRVAPPPPAAPPAAPPVPVPPPLLEPAKKTEAAPDDLKPAKPEKKEPAPEPEEEEDDEVIDERSL